MHQAGNHGSLAENEMFFNGIASVVYVSHFTPVVTKASYNIDALDDAWYHTPAAGGTRRLSAKGSPIEQDGT
jgi:hypothetical protein